LVRAFFERVAGLAIATRFGVAGCLANSGFPDLVVTVGGVVTADLPPV
jgi:hypothetical protein